MIFHGLRVLLAVFLALPLAAADQRLLSMLPANAEAAMGVDVRAVLRSNLGQEMMKAGSAETPELKEFTALTGLDLYKDIHEVMFAGFSIAPGAAAKGSADGVAMVLGNFQPARIGQAILSKGGVKSTYGGREIWYPEQKGADAKNALVFLDNSVAVAGSDAQVKRFLDGASGGASGLQSRVSDVSGRYDIWMVSMVSPAKLAGSMDAAGGTPEEAMGPLQGDMFRKIKASQGGIKLGPQIHIGMEMEAETAEDATALMNVLQFFQSMIAGGAPKGSEGMPEGLQQLLSSVKMRTEASMLLVDMNVPEADMVSFFKAAAAKSRVSQSSGDTQPAQQEDIVIVQ